MGSTQFRWKDRRAGELRKPFCVVAVKALRVYSMQELEAEPWNERRRNFGVFLRRQAMEEKRDD